MNKSILALTALALGIAAVPAAAQVQLKVTPFYGSIRPQGELPATFAIDKTDGGTIDIADGKFESQTTAYGVTAGLKLFGPISIEGTLLKASDELSAARRAPAAVDILAYSGGLELELPKAWRIEPFVIAGVGVKSYDFDIAGTKKERDYEYNIGGGANVALLHNVALNLQVRDMISSFSSSLFEVEDEQQNDILFAAGLTFRFGFGGKPAVAASRR